MDRRWYSAAFLALVVACSGSPSTGGGDTNSGGTGGAGSIDGGATFTTGGVYVADSGTLASGGNASQDVTGGSSSMSSAATGGVGDPLECPATKPALGAACSGGATCWYGESVDCSYPCATGCTLVPRDGSVISSGFAVHSVCIDGRWTRVPVGTCPTPNDCECATQN